MNPEQVTYRQPNVNMLNRLLPVARRVFTQTFGDRYETEAFEQYCDAVYRPGGLMSQDFRADDVCWFMAMTADEPIGYAKLTPLRAPAVDPKPGALELQQLYVVREWHGKGVADRLMQWALQTAASAGAPEIYLTVFDHNERAKRFYARFGFREVGRCTFRLGARVDDDRIWRAHLGAPTVEN